MGNLQRISIAKDFVNSHKLNDLDQWQPRSLYPEGIKLLAIYDNIVNGVYGEFRETGEGEFEIEIDRFASKDGNPFLFTFEAAEMRTREDVKRELKEAVEQREKFIALADKLLKEFFSDEWIEK